MALGTIGIWDSWTGKSLRQLDCGFPGATADPGQTERIAFTHDSKGLIAGGMGPEVYFFDLNAKSERREFLGHRGRVFSVNVSADGKRFATAGSDTTGMIWETPRR